MQHENWGYPNRGPSKCFLTASWVRTATRGRLLFRNHWPLQMQFCELLRHQHEANELILHEILWADEAFFTREDVFNVHTVTPGHGVVLVIYTNSVIKSTSASVFGLDQGHCHGPPICYLLGWLLNVISSKPLLGDTRRVCFGTTKI
jgi:hypothetical protein